MDIAGNFSFPAQDNTAALALAQTLVDRVEAAVPLVYYDRRSRKIVVAVADNDLGITSGFIRKFTWYDKSKGPFGEMTDPVSGFVFSPVWNPLCECAVTKDQFAQLIAEHYSEYLETHDKLLFEVTAYGVDEVVQDEQSATQGYL